jgi:hypothetical protein
MPQYKEQENSHMRNNQSDEIDLVVVFRYIRSFFRGIARRINFVFKAVLSNLLIMALIISVFLGIAFFIYYTTKPYYTSSMTLVLANIRNEFIEDQLDKLSEMISDDNFEAVAERLDIPSDNARQIKEMKFTNLDQNRIEEDSVLTGSPFRIELSIYNPQLFEGLEPAITNYLENNKYFARQKRIKQRQVENMITKLKGEISSIDSMKTSVGEPRGPVNGFVYGQAIDPTVLYRESISLYKEQVNLEADLEKLSNVEIVNGFIPRLRPTGPSLRKFLSIGGLIGLLIGIITTVIIESKRRPRAL